MCPHRETQKNIAHIIGLSDAVGKNVAQSARNICFATRILKKSSSGLPSFFKENFWLGIFLS